MNPSEKLIAKLDEVRSGFDFSPLKAHLQLDDWAFSDQNADSLIEAFLQFFCLHAVNDECVPLANPAGIIDEVYHRFILNNTEQYFAFCVRFFGKEIHHSHRTSCWQQEGTSREAVGDAAALTRNLLRLYGDRLHPHLQDWILHSEALGELSNEQRSLLDKTCRVRDLVSWAQALVKEAEKLSEELKPDSKP